MFIHKKIIETTKQNAFRAFLWRTSRANPWAAAVPDSGTEL